MTAIQGEAYSSMNDMNCSATDLVMEIASNVEASFMYLGIISMRVHKHEASITRLRGISLRVHQHEHEGS